MKRLFLFLSLFLYLHAHAGPPPPLQDPFLDNFVGDWRVERNMGKRGVHPKATVALTGRDDPKSLERCTEAGVTDVMVKPVPTSVLLKKTKEWLA